VSYSIVTKAIALLRCCPCGSRTLS